MAMGRGASIEAVERLYRDRGRDFFRFALAITGETYLAQDAVQEGFANAIRSRETFRGSGSLDGWVCRCVMNAARDIADSQSSASPLEERHDAAADFPAVDERLHELVRRLPSRQRETLFLRFYLDLDYRAIAEALGVEVGTVSATLHTARNELARALQEVRT
jgi:RNA polymerase sigma factor (sigma-70 family)